jgi:DNA-directed RNA polymerase subunit RPC12/RpoP
MPEYKCRECGKSHTLKHEPKRIVKRFKCPTCRRRITAVNKRTPAEREQMRRDLEESRDILNRFFFGARRAMSKSLKKK